MAELNNLTSRVAHYPRRGVSVICFTGNTGLSDYSVSLSRELGRLADVDLVTSNSFVERGGDRAFRILKIFRRTRYYPIDVFKLIGYALRSRNRIFLFQSWLKSPWLEIPLIALIRTFGIRVAITIHDLLPHYPKRWSKFEMQCYYQQFDRIIVHSEVQKNGLLALGVKTECLVVPHGVYDIFNTENMSKEAARSFFPSLSADDYVVLFFGFLGVRKGILEFLDCVSHLDKSIPVKLLIAGHPEDKKIIIDAIRRHRSHANVIVNDKTIPHDEVQRYFAACDVVALPYLEGTTSGVMKLAMAFSRPVICTDIGDFTETLRAWPGVVVDRFQLRTDLARCIEESYDRRHELAAKATNVSSELQWSNIASRYLNYLACDLPH